MSRKTPIARQGLGSARADELLVDAFKLRDFPGSAAFPVADGVALGASGWLSFNRHPRR
ncbi:hypothetical protein OU789_16175 [Halocynthiibacter sp. C4]|uniref:hypothetical protein n=1 Tax=Halocynthiibacter sp. C4 TaxID=2992758 RepID=UPI00237C4F24|nr:hypothetical protein [Halocynthiibacter sp. C4]MDE0591476.1 hypothetical protein [Halocynthiibacter sp. C4]